ncbi:MAG: alanine--tRNA ligase [Synergistaceae bacterium]|nr:alanine--tRNA ligase [Synergistaceae bacterium]
MQRRTASELRQLFVKFWEEKGSHHLPSFSLVPDDPSLLFTIAGMVPLKPYYLGIREPEHPRVVTSQKCVRTNDIENVGRTARHHTFFEMLGNFTWGSYFKKEAIAWAWEFLTERVGLEPDRLWASIYQDDEEAFEEWRKVLPENRILRFGQDENYWFMGETGPCGPCSEIYYDRGEKYGCGKPTCGVGCDCDRYMEIWNLVFTQFDRQKDGSLPLLPHKNIDTGMGLERLTSVVQSVDTDYETDIFTPLINHTCKRAGIRYNEGDAKNDMAVRVISDHVRAVAFMLADGILPSNDGPGYVLRRLLRRAVRFGKLLGFEGPFLCEYLPILIDVMGNPYRELIDQRPTIEQIITVEEERFQKTLQQGTDLFEEEARKLAEAGQKEIPGTVAFTLYDTYGFPPELTREMAEEKGLTVDEAGFATAMDAQRERARASSKQKHSALAGDVYTEIENESGKTRFTGYEGSTGTGKIIALLTSEGRADKIEASGDYELILDTTPFYAERGGEVGDTGHMTVGGTKLEVLNTVPHGGLIVHTVRLTGAGPIRVGDTAVCEVDDERRGAIRRNHTSTHLLHEALGRVLGRHVRQAGSLVADEFLRFDFTHHSPMTNEEIEKVERIVNAQILANTPVTTQERGREEAQKLGAKALFEEKYGDVVRVVSVASATSEKAPFSMELCGGLHVHATGDIGSFKILREESVGSGTRRILATTGLNVLALLQKLFGLRTTMTALLSTDEEGLKDKAQSLVDELRRLKNEIQAVKLRELTENADRFLERREVGGVLFLSGRFPNIQPAMLRDIGDKAKARPEPTVVALASVSDDEREASSPNCQLVVMADDKAVKLGANAGTLVREASVILGGKGGGRPTTAQGGGRDGAKLNEAFARVEALLKEQIGA